MRASAPKAPRASTPAELEALQAKYAEMRRLRLALETGDEPDPIGKRAALAAKFPGALRELDQLPFDILSARLEAVKAAQHDASSDAPWMAATARFHALLRGVLEAKRLLAGRRTVEASEVEELTRVARSSPDSEHLLVWAADLPAIARPRGGRLVVLVFARLAEELGVSVDEARRLVFATSGRGGGL